MRANPEELAAAFRAALAEPLGEQAGSLAQLGTTLSALCAQASAAWPEVELAPTTFAAYLAERLPPDGRLDQALRQVRAADLFLACACARGDSAALEAFERDYLRPSDRVLARFSGQEHLPDDVLDLARQRLLFGESPKISGYTGRGDLKSWVGIVVLRLAYELRRRGRKEVPLADDGILAGPAGAGSPELQYLKKHYRSEFRKVFREAVASLASAQRNLLRHSYLDGLTNEQIGALYQVHPTTIGRRLTKARTQLLAETRRRFLTRLQLGGTEFESVMRLVQSQLDLSIRTLLPTNEE